MKPWIIILLIALIAHSAFGQSKKDSVARHKFSAVGVYLGFNNTYTTKNGINSNLSAYNLSPLFGAYGIFEMNRDWQFETGLGFMEYDSKYLRFGYSSQGNKDTVYFSDKLVTTAYYITIPLIFKYILTGRSTVLGGIRGSGEIGNNLFALNGYKAGSFSYEKDDVIPNTLTYMNQFDLGLIFGYEYNFSDRLFVSVIYNFGLIPIFPKSFTDIQSYNSLSGQNNYFYPAAVGNYNNSLSIRVCYSFLTWGDERFELIHWNRHWHRTRFPASNG